MSLGSFSSLTCHRSSQQQQIEDLQGRVERYKKQAETSRRGSVLQRPTALPEEWRRTLAMNERLRNEIDDLRDENEEVKAMVEVLKQQMSGRTGLVGSPIASSPPR